MILLTGGSGYIGSHLVRALRAKGEEVKLLRHGEGFAATPDGWRLDLAIPEQLSQVPLFDVSALLHFGGLVDIRLRPDPAGLSHPPLPGDAPLAPLYKANVQTTAALADFCRERGIPIIFASSQTVYGMPTSAPFEESAPLCPLEPYAASKVAAESILRVVAKAGLDATVIRFPGVYGGDRHSGAVYSMVKSALQHRRIQVTAEFPLPFDVLHVDDVVSGALAALDRPGSGWRCFNLGSGEPCSLTLLADAIAALVPGCTVEFPKVAQPAVRLSTEATRKVLGWMALPRAERLSGVIDDVRNEMINAA